LCSDACWKVQPATAKQEFGKRARGDRFEQLDEAAYYNWYNRYRKPKMKKAADPLRTAAIKEYFVGCWVGAI